MTDTTATPALSVEMSSAQSAAFEALAVHGTQPKAVNTAQSLIRRDLVEIDADGDLAVTAFGWEYARHLGLIAPEAEVVVDFPAADEPNLPVEDETTTDDKAKAKATKTPKAEKTTEQTLRIPVQFGQFLSTIKTPTKATKAIVERYTAGDVDEKDGSTRIAVSDADLPVLLDHAKAMAQSATDGTAKRVANGRVRWIERMLSAKR